MASYLGRRKFLATLGGAAAAAAGRPLAAYLARRPLRVRGAQRGRVLSAEESPAR
jgi:hypothetical protein